MDGFAEPGRCFDSILGDRVAQKFSLILHEGALAQFRVRTVLPEGQDTSEMLQVLCLGLGVDRDKRQPICLRLGRAPVASYWRTKRGR